MPDYQSKKYIRRADAGSYLRERYGFCSPKTLAKLATVGGSPEYQKCGRTVLYTVEALDNWAQSRIGPPLRSTSEEKK
jgi:hypothetical protein